MLGCEIEFGTDPFGCRALGAHHIQIHLSAGKRSGIDAAEHDISVGHGRFCAASAVAHWAWIRACAVRSDDDPAESIDAGDRAAARADFDHFDHRNAQWQSAAFEKTVNARHLESTRGLRLRLVDKTDLSRSCRPYRKIRLRRGRSGAQRRTQRSLRPPVRIRQDEQESEWLFRHW